MIKTPVSCKNPVLKKMVKHHNVFYNFQCWSGNVPANVRVNFLGVTTRDEFLLNPERADARYVVTQYPTPGQMYFEWIDLLESVVAAKNHFTMIELGAGFGRWLVNSYFALQEYSQLPCTLIGVEAEPTHYNWMELHFKDNGIDPADHQLINAAVSEQDGIVWFLTGSPNQCYGQQIVSAPRLKQRLRYLMRKINKHQTLRPQKIKSVELNSLLESLTTVDFLDLDIQGAEFVVLNAAVEQLDKKVRKVHTETHNRKVEKNLRNMFGSLGWKSIYDFAFDSKAQTEWGEVSFQGGGLQTWLNPKLIL